MMHDAKNYLPNSKHGHGLSEVITSVLEMGGSIVQVEISRDHSIKVQNWNGLF